MALYVNGASTCKVNTHSQTSELSVAIFSNLARMFPACPPAREHDTRHETQRTRTMYFILLLITHNSIGDSSA